MEEASGPRERSNMGLTAARDQSLFALWLRGLTDWPQDYPPFLRIARGIAKYAQHKTAFYLELERHQLHGVVRADTDPVGIEHIDAWAAAAPARWAAMPAPQMMAA